MTATLGWVYGEEQLSLTTFSVVTFRNFQCVITIRSYLHNGSPKSGRVHRSLTRHSGECTQCWITPKIIQYNLNSVLIPKELSWIRKATLFHQHPCSCRRQSAYCTAGWYWPTLLWVPRQKGGGDTASPFLNHTLPAIFAMLIISWKVLELNKMTKGFVWGRGKQQYVNIKYADKTTNFGKLWALWKLYLNCFT